VRAARGPLLDLAAEAPWVAGEDLTGAGTVLVLAPHPDDEALGCGAAIVQARAAGHRVVVAVMTDGRRSHPNSRTHGPEALAALRRSEVERSVEILTGTADAMLWLGVPDCALPKAEGEIAPLVDALAGLVDHVGATALWSAWGGDPHCDHEATASIAASLCRRRPDLQHFSYPVWGRFADAVPDRLSRAGTLVRLETSGERDRKQAAVAAHRSQMTGLIDDDPEGFLMEPALQHHFIEAPEIFIREGRP